jgi:hypothetical protein
MTFFFEAMQTLRDIPGVPRPSAVGSWETSLLKAAFSFIQPFFRGRIKATHSLIPFRKRKESRAAHCFHYIAFARGCLLDRYVAL